ncbi:ATPase assembly factor ATP10, mitochondria [Cordyceps fumosorosea ARSEF 2679]|uniref:ATPase assembly factor ATP10, mitochondria n=1 Tax=Cordyceps fumosorosea (strain ARSEF 2679) TaxID=1081104 RepID=A0A168E8Y4_CORFA|nr:ATPase assembly factor ATP10, mitochondria [Cordyceps fumosorosea ARSEF 2679]OAA73517.1 ATPase assembly factor ATP10, mitochondria [Cordyceps fumosorosea ARSEF 2679]
MSSRRIGLAAAGSLTRQHPFPSPCARCQWRRTLSTTCARRGPRTEKPAAGASMDPQSEIAGPAIEAPRSYGKRYDGVFTPKPLPRPIGMPLPPRAGENTGIDDRTREQRKKDFADWDKHLARRKELTAQLSRPYFRDWNNLKYHDGKSFIAPPRLFKAEFSLFFPNLYGQTLLKDDKAPRDTTPLLTGKASVVSIFSSQWAEAQTDSFTSAAANPELQAILKQHGGGSGDGGDGPAQVVRVNYEDNAGKAWLVRMFMGSLRRRFPEHEWERYLLVRRGITDHIRECIGLLNGKVGYTYLVDQHCRVRWAASGNASAEERDGLNRGLVRLVDGIRAEARLPATAREPVPGRKAIKDLAEKRAADKAEATT